MPPPARRDPQRADFSATLPGEAFAAGRPSPVGAAQPAAAAPADAPRLRGAPLHRRLGDVGLPQLRAPRPADAGDHRFAVVGLLGNGATGQVYAVRDRTLERDVAVKVLASSRPDGAELESFVDEARTTAGLDHPNVLPIHEIDATDDGRIYFIMKKIDGRSLGEAIRRSTAERRDEAIEPNRLVSIVISLGHALAYAHHRGIVHQDLKPDNVMLGAYGEIILVDWGSATRADARPQRLYGTPLYMSPEQARRETIDARADIYCLGASLFHALILRPPTWHDDAEEFWRRKREGTIDPPTDSERRGVPGLLIDIALKALAAAPRDRYQKAEDLVSDLERYQAGMAISAHRDTLVERLTRWHRRHRRAIYSVAAAVLIFAAMGSLLYGERLKQYASWGSPILREDPVDDGWRRNWDVALGGFELRDGALVTTDRQENVLHLRRRIEGDIAIEFTGEVLAGATPGDLSVFWSQTAHPEVTGFAHDGLYKIQVGAFGNAYTAIIAGASTHCAYSDFRFEAGRSYRIRVEIDGAAIRLIIDGRPVCEYVERQPFAGGYLSLYGFYAGHAYRDIRIYARDIAERIPATAVGDAFFRRGLHEDAAAEFARVKASHPGTAIAREAAFRQGVCRFLQAAKDPARMAEAEALWRPLAGSEWTVDIALLRLEHRFASGDDPGVCEEIAALHRATAGAARQRVVIAWSRFAMLAVDDSYKRWDGPRLEGYLAVHDRLFPAEPIADPAAADVLVMLGRYREALERFPDQRHAGTRALHYLGHPEEVLTRYPGAGAAICDALHAMGRSDEIERLLPDEPDAWRASSMVKRGEAEAVLAKDPKQPLALIALGRLQEVIDDPGSTPAARRTALLMAGRPQEVEAGQARMPGVLLALGRTAEALDMYGGEFANGCWVRHAAGLDAYIAGDHARAFELFRVEPREEFHQSQSDLLMHVMAPFLRELSGETCAVAAECERIIANYRWADEQYPYFNARLLLGRIDERGFMDRPHRFFALDDLHFCLGVRAELAGDRAAARAAYRRFLAIPAFRRGTDPEPVSERFVQWRLQQLRD